MKFKVEFMKDTYELECNNVNSCEYEFTPACLGCINKDIYSPKEKKMIELKIDITKIEDELEGNHWQYIRPDFAFKSSINSKERDNFNAHKDGVLIHKYKNKDEMYAKVAYHLVISSGGKPEIYELPIKEIKKYMLRNLARFIVKHKKLPFGFTVVSLQKNGKVKLKYEPNEYTSYSLTINPIKIAFTQKRMNELKSVEENDLANNKVSEITIEPMLYCNLIENVGINRYPVIITNTKITAIDTRIESYREHSITWYFIHGEGGIIDVPQNKKVKKVEIEAVNFKCSENAMDKYKLNIGDIVSFKGQYKWAKGLLKHVHNIRSFRKNE